MRWKREIARDEQDCCYCGNPIDPGDPIYWSDGDEYCYCGTGCGNAHDDRMDTIAYAFKGHGLDER